MKRAVLTCLIAAFACAAFDVDAGYVVFKVQYHVNMFSKDANGEWLFDKKVDAYKFNGYFIFNDNFINPDAGGEAPGRIITFNGTTKYFPAKYDPNTESWIADGSQRATKKFMIYPESVTWPDESKTTSVTDNYTMTEGDPFYIFSGMWDTVSIEPSIYDKHVFIVQDYFRATDKTAYESEWEDYEFEDDLENMIPAKQIQGYSEIYTGYVRKNALPPVLSGYLSFYQDELVGKSLKAVLRYDKKMSTRVIPSDVANMGEAVNAVTEYLVSKRYASTWAEY